MDAKPTTKVVYFDYPTAEPKELSDPSKTPKVKKSYTVGSCKVGDLVRSCKEGENVDSGKSGDLFSS